MTAYKTMAHINSLGGELGEVMVHKKVEDTRQPYYIVDYNGVKCTAIFNCFVCQFYADDLYGVVNE